MTYSQERVLSSQHLHMHSLFEMNLDLSAIYVWCSLSSQKSTLSGNEQNQTKPELRISILQRYKGQDYTSRILHSIFFSFFNLVCGFRILSFTYLFVSNSMLDAEKPIVSIHYCTL